jgi:glycosyltransferase involved in cell wall biosynthesis
MTPRVLHLTKYMPEFPGGIERATHAMALAGKACGAKVKIIGATPRPEERIVSGDPVDTLALPIAAKIGSVPIVPGFFQLRSHLDEADVVHIHLPNPAAELGLLWYLRNRRTGGPRIIPVVHAPMVRWVRFARLWERWIHWNLLKRSDGVIFPSPQLADIMEGYRKAIDPKPVHIVPFGVKAPDRVVHPTLASRLGGPIRLLAIGRLVPYKGFDVLIRAVSQIQLEWTLTIAGQGPEHQNLRALIDSLGITSRVQLTERVPEAEKHALLSRCDILVMPSQSAAESFGLVAAEAFSHGKPVVTTDLKTGVAFLARGGQCGAVVPVRSPGRLADAIEHLMLNEEARLRAGAANLEFWRKELSPETFHRRYAEVLSAILAPRLAQAS